MAAHRGLEFTNEDNGDFLGVVGCVLGVHEWNDETDGLQEGGKTFSAVQTNYRAREASARAQVHSWSALSAAHLADRTQCKPQGCEDGARQHSPS
jgi:hypothetical protein